MPGMMDTILDLGLNDATTAGPRRGHRRRGVRRAPAASASRRSSATIVGVDDVPDDPWQQLRLAIEAVFRSWNSDRARRLPRGARASPTTSAPAVTVQAMVFGNRGADSGDRRRVHAQPGDRRAGPLRRRPVRRAGRGRRRRHPRDRADRASSTSACPAVAARAARRPPRRLEHHFARPVRHRVHDRARPALAAPGPGRQAQPAGGAADRGRHGRGPGVPADARARRSSASPPLLADPPTTTTGRSGDVAAAGRPACRRRPGVASGEIVTDARGRRWPPPRPAARVILVRAETSPDDVHGMARAAGILTARGGLASHAAVVARGWGIPAVVGAAGLARRRRRVAIGGRTLARGRRDHDRRRHRARSSRA